MKDAYYGVIMSSDSLQHYGVKGMKWGKHLFGLKMNNANMRFRETDAGTRTNNQNGKMNPHMAEYFKQRDARSAANKAANAAKAEAARAAAAAAEAEKEKKKKKSSGSKAKSSSSKTTSKKEEKKDKNALPDELIEKLKDPNAKLTTDEIRTRASSGTKKAKELIKKLPKNYTLEDIDDLWDNESDQRGVGYDAYVLEIAQFTAEMKYYDRMIDEAEKNFDKSKDVTKKQQTRVQINELKKKKQQSESDLRTVLRTGHSFA